MEKKEYEIKKKKNRHENIQKSMNEKRRPRKNFRKMDMWTKNNPSKKE